MKVTVTVRDIQRGKACSARNCPIAHATKRAFHTKNVVVLWNLRIDGRRYDMPNRALRFMRRFDDGESVAPFTFTVE